MADVYLGTNEGFTASDVILRTSAITITTAAVTGGTSGPLRNPLPPHRTRLRDDEEALLVAALL